MLGQKVTQNIGGNWWFTAGSTRDSTSQPQKIQECFVWLVIFAAVIEVHQRAWQHILEVISFGLFCATVLGCCTFLVEKFSLPSSGQFWLPDAGEGSWIVLKFVAGGAADEVSGSCLFVGAEGQNPTRRLLLRWAELCLGGAFTLSRYSRHNAHQHPTCLTRLLHRKGKKPAPRRRCSHPHVDTRSTWPIIYFCLR